VVIGGILSSTFLTLIVLPVLYAWFERKHEPPDKIAIRAETKVEPAFS
jgi:Cu/Ag efflux pump CusA